MTSPILSEGRRTPQALAAPSRDMMGKAAGMLALNGPVISCADLKYSYLHQKENHRPNKPVKHGKLILIAPNRRLVAEGTRRIDEAVLADRLRSKFGTSSEKMLTDYTPQAEQQYSDKELERELRKYRKGGKQPRKKTSVKTKKQKTLAKYADVMLSSKHYVERSPQRALAESILSNSKNGRAKRQHISFRANDITNRYSLESLRS